MGLSQGLFRREVIQAKRGTWLGSIMVATPLSRWLIVLLASALAVAIIAFLVFGHYTRRESVSGQLVPSAGLLNLVAPAAGTVTQVFVHDGQAVHAGDPLLEISSVQDRSALGDTHQLVGKALDAQRARLQDDLRTQQELARQQAQGLRDKVVLLRSQLTQIAGQMSLQQQQATSAQQLLDHIRSLSTKGYVSELELQQHEAAALGAQAQYKTLARQQLDTRQQLQATEQDLAQLPLNAATRSNDTKRQLASLSQSIVQNEMQRAVQLRAPHDGIVSVVLLKQGQMVGANQPLLTILPSGSILQAQLLVPSRAIGFIERGSRVVLRYQAFPYQKFGQQYGEVTEISRSALGPSDIAALMGQQGRQQEPLYRVRVKLDSQSVLAYGEPEPVKPGMALEADILMERRRLIEWVFEPLYGLGRRFK